MRGAIGSISKHNRALNGARDKPVRTMITKRILTALTLGASGARRTGTS
jgi:hypothetical protein